MATITALSGGSITPGLSFTVSGSWNGVTVVTLGGEACTILVEAGSILTCSCPLHIDLDWGATHTLSVTDADSTDTLAAVPITVPADVLTVLYDGTSLDPATTNSFQEFSASDPATGNFNPVSGDRLAIEQVDVSQVLRTDGTLEYAYGASGSGWYKYYDVSLSTWTNLGYYSIEDLGDFGAPVMPADTAVDINEGVSSVGTYAVTSGDTPITYTLSGADAAAFAINATTGALSFNNAPDYEAQSVYVVNVIATNAAGSDTQTITVNILNILEQLPTIDTGGEVSITLAQSAVYSDPAWTWFDDVVTAQAVTWSGDVVDTATPGNYTRTATATNAIGTTTQDYIITVQAADVIPSSFDVGVDVTGSEPGATYPRQFTVQGIDAGYSVAVTALGTASVSPSVARLGDTVTVTLVAGTFGQTVTGGASINGVADSFVVTSRAQIFPTVTQQPTNQAVLEGNAATFFATFNNAAAIQWYENGSSMPGEVNSTLTVSGTVAGDNGNTYYAIATSTDGGTVQTNTVTLTVTATGATVLPTINTGGNVVTTIQEGGSYSDPAWTWSDDVVTGQPIATWTGSVDTSTPGTYTRTATATNVIGSSTAVYTVTVEASQVVEPMAMVDTPSSRTVYATAREGALPTFYKDTSDVIDFMMDFSVALQADQISTVSIEAEYVTLSSSINNERQVQVWLSEGQNKQVATVTITITSQAGRTIERSFRIKVGEY